jgi:hypothetical protein
MAKDMLVKKAEENSHISIQKTLEDHFNPSSLALLNKSRMALHNDYSTHIEKVRSRKISPPGHHGLESVTALGL